MMTSYLFVVNMCMLKIMVSAEVVADGQTWTHRDTAAFNGGAKDPQNRNVQISPRMDFDEWTPLGRGDPLKNDPTFDYLPPVLDKVHYWKPPPSPASVRAHPSSTVASVVPSPPPPPQTVVHYNRRFFLTDFSSKKEPAVYAQYKRPQVVGYPVLHYPMPRVPLPMLTPPPYHRTTVPMQQHVTVAAEPSDFASDAGNSAAESKQPPTIRAPPPPPPPPHNAFSGGGVRIASPSHSAIKTLLENEVDRTTVTTAMMTTLQGSAAADSTTASSTVAGGTTGTTTGGTTGTTGGTTGTTGGTVARAPPITTDPLFAHYKQPAVTGRPMMYLIIQGHSKVKTYGLLSKSDDLTAQPAAAAVAQDHNHIGNRPDEQSRRKRDGPATMTDNH